MEIDWHARGVKFGNCNCDYSCPCQFEANPTHGSCHGIEVFNIERGRFGDVVLDGLTGALFYSWPGPIHAGRGEMQAIIDDGADPAQREALGAILHGEQTKPGATHWWVFHAMSSRVHETIFIPIEFEINVDARTAWASIPGLLEASGVPIRSPVSGEPHRVRIDLPNGVEFELAEIGSGSARVSGAVRFGLDSTYGQFNRFHLSRNGIVRGGKTT